MVVTARTTPPSGILPFHTVISFIFRRCDDGDMLVINASNHTGDPEGNSDYWVTSRRHRKTSFVRLASFKPISTPLTYSPEKLLFDGFVLMKKNLRKSVRVMHTCALHLRCFEENYHLKWYRSNQYAHEYGVKNNNKIK